MKTCMRSLLTSACAALLLATGFSVPTTAHADTITYYHNDFLGSPVVATNSAGAVLWRQTYKPYGERMANEEGSFGNKIRYTSRHEDDDTGLVYMGARYYDPVVGRFTSVDPVRFDGINAHSFGRYAYVNNNPYKYIDPDGRVLELALRSSDQFRSDVHSIRGYLRASTVAVGVVDAIDCQTEIVTVQQGAPGVMMYVPSHRTIYIDSRSGNRVGDGLVQSPALGFLHEAAHALGDVTDKEQFDAARRTLDSQYGNKEERRVIESVETPAAKVLGEPARKSNEAVHAPVQCATCRR